MAFALPVAASAMAAAAPAAAAAATKVSLMAIAKSVLMNVAISAAMSALQPQVGSAGKTFEWTLDPNAPIPFAAGRVGVAGTVAHLETYGPDKMYYGFVSVLSGAGPIRSITGFRGDDEFVSFDGNGKAISSQWAGEMWFRSRLGTQPDTALANPPGLKNNAQLPGWSAASRMSGKACYMLVLGENSKRSAYLTGEPKPLVTIEGLFGWDPRQDSTYPGGVGACRLNNPATWVWLDNPILWALKWSLGLWEGPVGKGAPGVDYQVGGIGAKVEGIDLPAFVAAANVADANGWKVAAYPTTDDDKAQVLDSFLQAGGAIYSERAGRISCIQRAAPRASVITISAADTAGPLEIDTAASRLDRINTIRPRFWSEAHRWQMTAIDDVSAAAYREQDGAVRPRGIDYPYVPLATQTAQLAALQIANTREGIAGTIPLKPHLRNITPGTAFTITEPGFLLDGLKCLALNVDYNPMTGVVSVDFVSETDAKYPFALGQSPIAPVPPALIAPDLTVTPPTVGEWALTAANFTNAGVSVPALLFAGSVANSRAQSVIFEFRPVGAADWSGAGVEDQTVTRKEGAGGLLTAGVQYEGAVSYRVGGNISDRLILGPVLAGTLTAGDLAPVVPGNVAGVPSLAITTTIAPDGTQTSRLFGDFADAADAVSYVAEIDDGSLVQQVPLAESAIEDRVVATGPTYRYRVRAISRTGTPSAGWSAWSNASTAGGDNTPPAPISAPYIQGGIGQIAMRWTNPADDDLQRVLIFRNVSGTSPQVTAEAPYAWATGTNFIDQAAEIGQAYHYWGLTQDRTGNGAWANLVYIGTASARRTRFDTDLVLVPPRLDPHPIWGGDYLMTDRLVFNDGILIDDLQPGEAGSNKTETRVAASVVGQGALALANSISTDSQLGGTLYYRLAPYAGDPNYLSADRMAWSGTGGTVQSLKPGEAGANVTEGRTAASFIGQGALATKNAAAWGADVSGRPLPLTDLHAGIYIKAGYALDMTSGASLAERFPAEYGSNVTETRTASAITGQGYFATQNYADWATRITGTGKPSDNAGTSLALRAFTPVNLTIQGNTIRRAAATPGDWDGSGTFISMDRYVGACQVSFRVWEKSAMGHVMVGLDDDPTPTADSSKLVNVAYHIHQGADGAIYVFKFGNPAFTLPQADVAVGDVFRLSYTGTHMVLDQNGVPRWSEATVSGRAFYAVGEIFYGGAEVRDLRFGPRSDSAKAGVHLIQHLDLYILDGTAAYRRPGSTADWIGNWYSAEGYVGSCTVAGRLVQPSFFGLSDGREQWGAASYTALDYSWHKSEDGNIYAFESGAANAVFTDLNVGMLFSIEYTGARVNYYADGVLKRSVAVAANRQFWAGGCSIYGGSVHAIRDIVFGPGRQAAILGQTTFRGDTFDAVPQSDLRTPEGVAAAYAGQTPWGTLTRSIVSISRIDDTGRIIDGQALPLNGMSKSSTLNPPAPFSAGADPTTQINVAAATATFAGGSTLSFGSATISGLAASTYYSIFRDLLTNSYVAVSGSTTAYFTSAQRYLYVGTQATQQVGGGYEPLPPPPPGSGGGYGDIPIYLEP